MDIQMLTSFFMWCTIINGALLVFWTTMCILVPDLVYRTQSRWFPMGATRPARLLGRAKQQNIVIVCSGI